MHRLIAVDINRAEISFDFIQYISFGAAQRFGDLRMNTQRGLLVLPVSIHRLSQRAGFLEKFITNCLRRLDQSRSLAVVTRRAQCSFKRLLYALSRHDHQAEIIKRKNLCWRLVAPQRILQRPHHPGAIPAFFHVDQVEHDDAAQIAQANLSHNFINRLEVGASNRVFETTTATSHKFAGVDINRDQRLGLVYYEVTTRLEPHARFDRFINLRLHAVGFKDRLIAGVELHTFYHARLDAVHKVNNGLVFLFRVDADGGKVVRQLIAKNTLNQIQIFMNQGCRLRFLGCSANVEPGTHEIANVFP